MTTPHGPISGTTGWGAKLMRRRYLIAIVAGLAMAGSFPNFDVAGLAWLSPGLMVLAAFGTRGWESFRVGYVAGMAHYLGSLFWLLNIPYKWHGIPLAPALGWVALSAFLSLFVGAWMVFVVRECPIAAAAGKTESVSEPGCGTWLRRTTWGLKSAAAWVALEMVVTRIFGGFPWNMLGSSQYQLTPLLQIAEWTAVYGISFLIVWFSVALFCAGLMAVRGKGGRSMWLAETAVPILVIALTFNVGYRIIQNAPNPSGSLSLTMVQPSIPQTLIWDPDADDQRFQALIRLSREALKTDTDVLIWPESAVPKLLRYDEPTFSSITELAAKHRVWMIIGADDAEPRRNTPAPNDADYFNSSFLISPEGKLVGNYRKRSLVIFGEYIPLIKWVSFLSWFTPIQGGFTPGDQAELFRLGDLGVAASVLICYEDVFPQLGRSGTKTGADFLLNLTNNGWFGEGAAQRQHAITALLRAIENRRPLVRCTNNGLTCWVDEYGRIREVFRDASGSVYGEGLMRIALPLRQAPMEVTFYTRHGDVFGWICVAITGVLVALQIIRNRKWRRTLAA